MRLSTGYLREDEAAKDKEMERRGACYDDGRHDDRQLTAICVEVNSSHGRLDKTAVPIYKNARGALWTD